MTRLFHAHTTTELLDALLEIKRIAESHDDRGYDPFILLELIAEEVQQSIAKSMPSEII